MDKEKLYKNAALCIVCAGGVIITYVLFKYVLPTLFPFIFAALVGLAVFSLARRASRKTKIPLPVCGIALGILLYSLIGLSAYFAFDRILGEISELSESLSGEGGGEIGNAVSSIVDYVSNLTENLPIIRDIRRKSGSEELWQDIDRALASSITDALSSAAQRLPELIGNIISGAPTVLLGLCVSVIASFYFCTGSAARQIRDSIPEKTRKRLADVKKRTVSVLGSWARGYLLIMLETFCTVFVGLLILRVKYAFLAALIIAFVDILPVFGTGTVLLPWSVIAFVNDNNYLGFGLIILYAAVTLIRQVSEPKIIGKSLGVPPLLTLVAMYGGLRLFGFFGMIAAPAFLMLVLPVFRGEDTDENKATKTLGAPR